MNVVKMQSEGLIEGIGFASPVAPFPFRLSESVGSQKCFFHALHKFMIDQALLPLISFLRKVP